MSVSTRITGKHVNLMGESIEGKLVTDLPGIGQVTGSKMRSKNLFTASQILNIFLSMNGNKGNFEYWLKKEFNANSLNASRCSCAMECYSSTDVGSSKHDLTLVHFLEDVGNKTVVDLPFSIKSYCNMSHCDWCLMAQTHMDLVENGILETSQASQNIAFISMERNKTPFECRLDTEFESNSLAAPQCASALECYYQNHHVSDDKYKTPSKLVLEGMDKKPLMVESPSSKMAKRQIKHNDECLITQKHKDLVENGMENKAVTGLPGIGEVTGGKMIDKNYNKASQIYEVFINMKRDKRDFEGWLSREFYSNSLNAARCSSALACYYQNHHEKNETLELGLENMDNKLHSTKMTKRHIVHRGECLMTQEHMEFVEDGMDHKVVTDLPGIGEVAGGKMIAENYDKASQIYEVFLNMNRDKIAFMIWLYSEFGFNDLNADQCASALNCYYQNHHKNETLELGLENMDKKPMVKLPPTKMTERQIVHSNDCLMTQKHMELVEDGMDNKVVTYLPGIGEVAGGKMIGKGYSKASQIYKVFLNMKRDKLTFKIWLNQEFDSNSLNAERCAGALECYYQNHEVNNDKPKTTFKFEESFLRDMGQQPVLDLLNVDQVMGENIKKSGKITNQGIIRENMVGKSFIDLQQQKVKFSDVFGGCVSPTLKFNSNPKQVLFCGKNCGKYTQLGQETEIHFLKKNRENIKWFCDTCITSTNNENNLEKMLLDKVNKLEDELYKCLKDIARQSDVIFSQHYVINKIYDKLCSMESKFVYLNK